MGSYKCEKILCFAETLIYFVNRQLTIHIVIKKQPTIKQCLQVLREMFGNCTCFYIVQPEHIF